MNAPADPRLSQIIAEYLLAIDAGSSPDPEEYTLRYPDLAEHLRAFFTDQERMNRLASPLRPDDPDATQPPGPDLHSATMTHCASGETGTTREGSVGKIRYFGDYELISEIARGGMGVVFKARQVTLNRTVAVKMILKGEFAGPQDVQRFRAEAEAAGNLDHPNILPIHEVGEHEGQQYFSMKLVEGESLGNKLSETPHPAIHSLVELLSRIARAVHFAHQRGILHRDIKPANVLIDQDGTPYITDFGLAKRVEGDSTLTQSGAIVGTPSYMAPEQARGERQLSTGVDVYSLGAILYEMITGQPPFKGSSVVDTLIQVREKEPENPRKLNPNADRDLSVVALKCLEKDPARRYESASALADDLDRWCRSEPITARPIGALERGRKWVRRNPVVATLVTLLGIAVVSGTTLSTFFAIQSAHQAYLAEWNERDALDNLALVTQKEGELREALKRVTNEQERTQKANAAYSVERRAAYVSGMGQAANEWAGNYPSRMMQLLDAVPSDLRNWEWHHLQRIAHAYSRELTGITNTHAIVGFTKDGRLLVTHDNNSVRVWDFATGKVIRDFDAHSEDVMAAAIHPDGKRAASSSYQSMHVGNSPWGGEVVIWEIETGKVLRTFAQDHDGVMSLTFSSDGKKIATRGHDSTVRLWEVETGKEIHRWTVPPIDSGQAGGNQVAFHPSGRELAALAGTGTVVWSVETKAEIRSLKNEVFLAYSPDGKLLATLRDGMSITIWNTESGDIIARPRITLQGVVSGVFTPDSKRLAIGGMDGLIQIIDVASKAEVYTLRSHEAWVTGMAYSPDGRWLVTSGGEPIMEMFEQLAGRSKSPPAIRVWDAARGQDYHRVADVGPFHANPLKPEVAIGQDKEVQFRDLITGAKIRSFTVADKVTHLAYSPDGSTLAVNWDIQPTYGQELSPGVRETKFVKNPYRVGLFDSQTGRPRGEEHAAEAQISDLAFSPNGSILAATNRVDGKFFFLDVVTLKVIATLEGKKGGVTRVLFTPDGKTLIRSTTGSVAWSDSAPTRITNGAIEFWDVADRKIIRSLDDLGGFINAMALTSDGKTLAIAVKDELKLIGVDSNQSRSLPITAHSLAFSPNGERLLTATPLGVKLWDLESGRDIFTLGGKWSRGGNSSQVAFAGREGLLLVSDGDVRVYDGRPWIPPPPKSGPGSPELPEPRKTPPLDARPEAVKLAAKASSEAIGSDPAAALLHAIAALEADPDPTRQNVHRLRIALAWQALPKLRPVVPPGAKEPTGFARDSVADPSCTQNFGNPLKEGDHHDFALISGDGSRLMVWNHVLHSYEADEAKKAGRSPWHLQVFDLATGKPVGPEIDTGRLPPISCCAISPDGKRVAIIFPLDHPENEKSCVVRMWDAESGKRLGVDMVVKRGPAWDQRAQFIGRRFLVVSDRQNRYQPIQTVFDLETGKPLELPEPFVTAFSTPGEKFLVTSASGRGRSVGTIVRDYRTLTPLGKLIPLQSVTIGDVTADGKTAVLGHSYYLGPWDLATGQRRHGQITLPSNVEAVAISPDGTCYAASYQDSVEVRDIRTGDAISPPIPLGFRCRSIQFTSDGTSLIVETESNTRIWDARTGEALSPILGDTSGSFNRNNERIEATLTGNALLVRRRSDLNCFDRWQLTPDPRPVGELKTLAETITGQRREVNGTLVPIPTDELLAQRRETLAKHPEFFGSPIAKAGAVMTVRPDPRVPQLVKMLGDFAESPERRTHAARMLGEIHAIGTQPDLVRTLRTDPAVSVRVTAAATLGDLGKLEPATIEALLVTIRDENDAYLRSTAVRALRTAAKETFKDLIRLLREDKTVNVRASAAYALRYGPDSNDTVLAALRAARVEGQPWLVRVESAHSLAILQPMDVESVKVLAQAAAQQADSWPQSVATSYLDELGPRASVAVPVLVRLVEKGHYQPHFTEKTWHAVHALARIGPGAKEALPVLLARLDQDVANAHWFDNKTKYVPVGDNMMAFTIARIGPSAIPELLKIVRDAEAPQRRVVILAQGPLGPTHIFGTVLLTRIEERVQKRRRAAVIALGFLGPAAKDTLAELEALRMQQGEYDKFMDVALEKAIGRIADPKAVPLDQFDY